MTTLVIFIISLLSACSGSDGAPYLAVPDEPAPAAEVAVPSVDENLARQSGVERLIFHIGPVDLPAGTSVDDMLAKPLIMKFQADKEIWVTGYIPKVIDSNGNELPGELLHQAIVSNVHEENPLCAGSPNPFAAATSMLTEVNFPKGYGYPILSSDPIEAKVVLKNTTGKSYIDVSFELTLIARPMDEYASIRDLKPMLLEPDPCGHAPIEVPPHSFTQKNATYQVPGNTGLVMASGIIHDYGAAVQLTAGKDIMPFWRAEAIDDASHRITALTGNPFEDSEGIGFKQGDSITLGVTYDNTADKWLSGVSGAAMVYFFLKE